MEKNNINTTFEAIEEETAEDSKFEYKQDLGKTDYSLIMNPTFDRIMEARNKQKYYVKVLAHMMSFVKVIGNYEDEDAWTQDTKTSVLNNLKSSAVDLMFMIEDHDIDVLAELTRVYEYGAVKKYKPHSWKKIPDAIRRVSKSTMRHIEAVYQEGFNALNEEDGLLYHVAQVLWGLETLIYHVNLKK